jgi:hypothetical protein
MMTASQCQTTLNSFTTQKAAAPFSMQGLKDHLVQLIIAKDEAFHLLDKPAFHQLIHYLRPTLPDKEISHHTKIREEVLAHVVEAKYTLKASLQVREMLSLLCDMLTMLQGH